MRPRRQSNRSLGRGALIAGALSMCAVAFSTFAAAEPDPASTPPAAAQSPAPAPTPPKAATDEPSLTMETFLDRLMMVESGGRAFAKNPLSTAIGPFQFIASTWLQIAHEAFPDEIKDLKPHEVLALRTDTAFARRAAHRYTMQNAAYLVANGQQATFPNLRLAHLVGAGGAVRVLGAKPETPVVKLLGATVIGANPFMAAMTADDLIGRATREIAVKAKLDTIINPDPDAVASLAGQTGGHAKNAKGKKAKARPAIAIDCNLSLASCRKWLALAKRRSNSRHAQR